MNQEQKTEALSAFIVLCGIIFLGVVFIVALIEFMELVKIVFRF